DRRGVLVPGDRGTRRTGHADRDHQPAVFGVDASVSESAAVQGTAGPHHRPRAHHRNRHGIVSLPAHGGRKAKEKSLVTAGTGIGHTTPWPRRPLRPKRGPGKRTAGLRSLRGHGTKT